MPDVSADAGHVHAKRLKNSKDNVDTSFVVNVQQPHGAHGGDRIPPVKAIDDVTDDTGHICSMSSGNSKTNVDTSGFNAVPRLDHAPFFGVYEDEMCWYARITSMDGRTHRLGPFKTNVKAAMYHDEAAKQHHGPVTRQNYQDEDAAQESRLPHGQDARSMRRKMCSVSVDIDAEKGSENSEYDVVTSDSDNFSMPSKPTLTCSAGQGIRNVRNAAEPLHKKWAHQRGLLVYNEPYLRLLSNSVFKT